MFTPRSSILRRSAPSITPICALLPLKYAKPICRRPHPKKSSKNNMLNPAFLKSLLVWSLGLLITIWAFSLKDHGKIAFGFFLLGQAVMAVATFIL